jgi:two-component system, LuxR family, sensor kinase FixL
METANNSIFKSLSSGLLGPVMEIQHHIDLLKKRCNFPDKSLAEETYSLSEDAIENIFLLMDSFQFMVNSDQLKSRLNFQWFTIQDLLTQIREDLKSLNLDVSLINLINLPHELKVFSDQQLLRKILTNLLGNGIKFSGRKVDLNISISRNKMKISVCDYGIGIPDNQINDIFIPFVKAENAMRFPGTGIGLAIVSKAVEALSGAITVHSVPLMKTEFLVELPYHQPRRLKQTGEKKIINYKKNTVKS